MREERIREKQLEYLVTAAEMKACDRYTTEGFGMPSLVLMERAALACAQELPRLPRASLLASLDYPCRHIASRRWPAYPGNADSCAKCMPLKKFSNLF